MSSEIEYTLLTKMSGNLTKHIMSDCGNAVLTYGLHRINELQEIDLKLDLIPLFQGDVETAKPTLKPKIWQTFDGFANKIKNKDIKNPFTVSADVKVVLTSIFNMIADEINQTGTIKLGDLINNKSVLIINLLHEIVSHNEKILQKCDREFDIVDTFVIRFIDLLSHKFDKSEVRNIANLFKNFVQIIGWHAATQVYYYESLTLNVKLLISIIAELDSHINNTEMIVNCIDKIRNVKNLWDFHRVKPVKAAKNPAAIAAKKEKKKIITEAASVGISIPDVFTFDPVPADNAWADIPDSDAAGSDAAGSDAAGSDAAESDAYASNDDGDLQLDNNDS